MTALSVPPAAAIEIIEPCLNGHADDCLRGPGFHDWRRVDPGEFPTYPDAEFVCNGCSALGAMVRPLGVVYP